MLNKNEGHFETRGCRLLLILNSIGKTVILISHSEVQCKLI